MSQSRILVKGKVVPNEIPENPDVCPLECRKKRDLLLKRDLRFIEPQTVLLTRHHADKRIGLFCCDGCSHLLFKSLIVPTPSRAQKLNMHLTEETIEISSTEKIAPLITTTMTVDNKETRILEHEALSSILTDENMLEPLLSKDFFTLTERIWKLLRTRGFTLTCYRCGEPITVGSLYHRSGAGRRTKKFYHKGCWETLLH